METSTPANSKLKLSKVVYLCDHKKFEQQEKLYLSVRKKEGRLFSDQTVKMLPDITPDHALYNEWQIRKKSLQRIILYLKKKKTPMRVLDLGCGNGWMANQLAEKLNCQVYALDLNCKELEQGGRVFGGNPNLNFQYGNIFEPNYPDRDFDFVLLASSVQYFPDIQKLLNRLLELLSVNGEIQIIDSPFYQPQEVLAAQERSKKYYQELGLPEMTNYYFHHSINDLNKFDYHIMYDPNFLFQRIVKNFIKNLSPFPWIRIKNLNQG